MEMITILIAIAIAFSCGGVLLKVADSTYSTVVFLGGLLLVVAAGIAAVCYGFMSFNWYASEYKATIINREYNTNYTREEVFWGSDVIDTIRELERKRVEVNGDLLREEKE